MSSSSFSSAADFYRDFHREKARIQALVDSEGLLAARTDALARVQALADDTKRRAQTLPPHDRQAYAQELDRLYALLDSKAAAQAKKPARFKFSKTSMDAAKASQAESRQQQLKDAEARRELAVEMPHDALMEHRVAGLTGEVVRSTCHAGGNLLVADLQRSVVLLTPATTPYATAKIDRCTDSLIFIDAVTGPIYLNDLVRCVVVAACHQFRIHTSTATDIFLSCGSRRPIIEHCSRLRFAQLDGFPVRAPITPWTAVDDFNWLDPHTPSTNWTQLPAADDYREDLAASLAPLLPDPATETETRETLAVSVARTIPGVSLVAPASS